MKKKFEVKNVQFLPVNVKLSGSLDLGNEDCNKVVSKALGGDPDFSLLFTYMFRRFGAPFLPQDDYKELCKYVLTTPMKNVYLSIHPTASNYNFGFIYPQGTIQKIEWGNYPERIKWCQRMQKWAKKNHAVNIFGGVLSNLSIYTKPDKKGNCTIEGRKKILFMAEINKWLFTSYPEWAGDKVVVPADKQQEVIKEFIEYKEDELGKYTKLYQKVEKIPKMQSKEGLKLKKHIIKAISVTAKDLLKPTYIRDVYFNVLSNECNADRSSGKELSNYKSSVKYFDYNTQSQILRTNG